jgi:hypothetical protein
VTVEKLSRAIDEHDTQLATILFELGDVRDRVERYERSWLVRILRWLGCL